MNPHSPASSSGYPSKRARHSPAESASPAFPSGASPPTEPTSAPAVQSSSFRNVSACNRCRLRKNRCDQKLPSCASCEKANVRCTGYDPITKREIPRSYVFYLETRISYLEALLSSNHIPYAPAEVLDTGPQHVPDNHAIPTPIDLNHAPGHGSGNSNSSMVIQRRPGQKDEQWRRQEESSNASNLVEPSPVSNVSDPRHLGATSGISFARVVFAAVKSSVSGSTSDKGGVRPSNPISVSRGATGTSGGSTSMRDSFFGLHPKPTIKQAPFPDKELGLKLVNLYFEHANPQIPILHRPSFMEMFENAYRDQDRPLTSREEYILNIVFATGAGIVYGDGDSKEGDVPSPDLQSPGSTRGCSSQQCQPEEYHASAIVHLEACLSHSSTATGQDGFGGGLEELQAVLLLAGFALLRPVAPGLWYIVGVAVRLGIDLGLHYEDGKDIEIGLGSAFNEDRVKQEYDHRDHSARERGRRQWIRDLRRRLWWCVYSFDRLVSTCVGRPFGITDQVITTEFPSLLDDKYITPGGFVQPQPSARLDNSIEPSYKYAAHHYFRLRLLQSEILQVLQHQQAKQARAAGANKSNPFMYKDLPSPFLANFSSFRDWRIDIDRRLWHWKESAPTKTQTGVAFSVEFLELNYWQAVIMLYRQSLSVPPMFVAEVNLVGDNVESPSMRRVEERDDEERVYLKVAEAGQKVLRLYRQLHRVRLVNYTFLATHHLFMAGISFLYAIWHSPIVRSRLTMDEVDFTILAATSVLGDMIEKCPPAEACRDAFDRMSKATVQMCMNSTGFSSSAQGGLHSRDAQGKSDHDYFNRGNRFSPTTPQSHVPKDGRPNGRSVPNFDMALNDLYSPVSSAASPIRSPQYGAPLGNNNNSNDTGRARRIEAHVSYPQAPQPPNYSLSSTEVPRDANSAIDPSLLPPQIPQQQQRRLQAGHSPYVQMPTSGAPGNQSTYNDQFSNSPEGLEENGTNWSNMNLDFLGGGTPGDGVDLGFGLGYESLDHDFSTGNQHDLFEGFFFGGAGNF